LGPSLRRDQIGAWLARIGIDRPAQPDAAFLDQIQKRHLRSVPFEALDISPLGVPFTLALDDVFTKVVIRRRGGFCYELNSLLAAGLTGLGYQVDLMGAHFTDHPDTNDHPLDHMPLVVTVPDDGSRWLLDVAAGRQSPARAVPIDGITTDGVYRTHFADGLWHLNITDHAGGWLPQFAWLPDPFPITAFAERCAWFQTDPESPFRRSPLCTIVTDNGRLTLSGWTLIETSTGERSERRLANLAEVAHILTASFGIAIDLVSWPSAEEA
jgi:N-hydroxyarylamine O-acetyltransferase